MASERPGRRMTACASRSARADRKDVLGSCAARRARRPNTRRPISRSSAGSRVIAAVTVHTMTSAAATPMVAKLGMPLNARPVMPIRTQVPATTTERPAAALASAAATTGGDPAAIRSRYLATMNKA